MNFVDLDITQKGLPLGKNTMWPYELREISRIKSVPDDTGSDYQKLVDRTFEYTHTNLNSAINEAAAKNKVLVVLTGNAKMAGIKDFLMKGSAALKRLPASKDAIFVYIDLDQVKKDSPLAAKLAKLGDADAPQALIINLKPGLDKKPVLDLDSVVTTSAANTAKFAKLLSVAKEDVVAPERFVLPKTEGKEEKTLPRLELVNKTKDDEEKERKAMEGLARLFQIQQKQREKDKAADKERRTKAREEDDRRRRNESKEIDKKYPHLKYFAHSSYEQLKWLDKEFPHINAAKFWKAYREAWSEPRSVWNSDATNNRLSGQAQSKLYREREEQWKEFLKLAGEDSEKGHKAYAVALGIMKNRGYPMVERDAKRSWVLEEKYTKECAKVVADRCNPGKPNRDLAAYLVRYEVKYVMPKDRCNLDLYRAFKNLAKPDGKDKKAPLTSEQMRFSLEDILDWHVMRGKEGDSIIVRACLDDLKTFNNPDTLDTLYDITRYSDYKTLDAGIRRQVSELAAHLRRSVSDRWTDQVPEPYRKEKDRASDLKAALDKELPKLQRGLDSEASDELVTAVARNYKFHKLKGNHTDSIKQLTRALECNDASVRVAAARVFVESDLPADHADRIKASKSLIELIINDKSGERYRKEAYAILDHSFTGTASQKIGDFKLSKEARIGLVIEDKKRNWYNVVDDGYLNFNRWESDDDCSKVTLEENKTKVQYKWTTGVTSRTAVFDGDELKEISWTEEGRFGPFVATRLKEEGKYVDKYKLRIPPSTKNGLSTDRAEPIKGKFELSREGRFKYVGEDWITDSGRRLHQYQERNRSMRQYTTK
jgi:hypothetical protein